MSTQYSIETEDWKLACFMDWQPKQHSEKCPECNGKGEIGGGFKSMDDATACPKCWGSKIILKGPRTPRPELPVKLVEHMRRAWWDFFNTNESK